MALNTKLDLDQSGKSVMQNVYCNMINSVFYLTANRLDIMFSACLCVRFQSSPIESHLIAITRVLDILLVPKTLVYGISKLEALISLLTEIHIMLIIR